MATNQRLLIDIGQGLSLMVGRPTITTWKTKERPKKAKPGTIGFNLDTKNLEYWDGESWFASRMNES